jgi:phospho-N-acetylmuramoyl-pentapeptide-transferase
VLSYLSELLAPYWGPARLLSSYVVLATVGSFCSAVATVLLLPRLWHLVTTDKGRAHAIDAEQSVGKPVGVGIFIVLITVVGIALFSPVDSRVYFCFGAMLVASAVGYLDDFRRGGLSEITLGLADLAISVFVCVVILNGHDAQLWLPFTATAFDLPFWLALLVYVPVVWICINATNCSDGVDGVSGTLSAVTICVLGFILYMVVGDVNNAEYLLVPFRADAANWAVAAAIFCGAIIGYLWHNAPPSAALMGDAGSRPIGLFIGMCIVVSGNPAIIFFVAPLLLFNGATGLAKVALIRVFGWRILDSIRFPFHDHVRKNLQWSNAQVLLRFLLIHLASLFFLVTLLIKVR